MDHFDKEADFEKEVMDGNTRFFIISLRKI